MWVGCAMSAAYKQAHLVVIAFRLALALGPPKQHSVSQSSYNAAGEGRKGAAGL